MKRVKNSGRRGLLYFVNIVLVVTILSVHSGLLFIAGNRASAQATRSELLIVAIQTGAEQAKDESIWLFNATGIGINLQGHVLEYYSAAPKDKSKPSRSFKLAGSLASGQIFILSTEQAKTSSTNQIISSTLSAKGGHLRLQSEGRELDMVGWGSATFARGEPATAPQPGQILERKKDNLGNYINTGNNSHDFTTDHESYGSELESNEQVTISETQNYNSIILTELLPNPASPALDSKDEFIEMYNTGNQAVDLSGCNLLVGQSLDKKYAIKDHTIQPGEFLTLYITETRLSLANSGSSVQLQTPDGVVLSETTYGKAEDGQSWSYVDQSWQWSSTSTPNYQNDRVVSASVPSRLKTSTGKNSKTIAKKETSSKAAKATEDKAKTDASEEVEPPIHKTVVAGVAGAAVLYGAYEYRQDVRNLYRKLRGNRKARRETGF